MLRRKFFSIALFIFTVIFFLILESEDMAQARNQLPQTADGIIEMTPANSENFLDEFVPPDLGRSPSALLDGG